MNTLSRFCAVTLIVVLMAPTAPAQESPKPGPEHEILKKMEGTWDATMKFNGMESKGTMIYKMEVGGLWLVSTFDGDFGGGKFSGKGLDTYDAGKKKFISVWVDSMVTTPMILEGTYDKAKKTLTMTTDYPGPDGKTVKWKSTTEMTDDNNMTFNMFMGDGKDPAFTIVYKRKK